MHPDHLDVLPLIRREPSEKRQSKIYNMLQIRLMDFFKLKKITRKLIYNSWSWKLADHDTCKSDRES